MNNEFQLSRSAAKSKHVRLPKEMKKIDLLEKEDAQRMIQEHREAEKHLFPMKIRPDLTIYVTKDKLNEEYKNSWMEKFGYIKKKKEDDKTKHQGKLRIQVDLVQVRKYLSEGYSVVEIMKEMHLSNSVLYRRIKDENIYVPTLEERVQIMKKRGMSIDEISTRVGTLKSIIETYYHRV